ncbi:MAG: GNAT family N-acetyltransferase [Bacillota bacterium]
MLKLRRAEEADRERILEISSEIWEGDDYLPNVLDAWLNDDIGEFTVGELDGRVIGCAKYTRLNSKEAWLEGIRGDKKYSGNGFGSAMTEYYINKAKAENLDYLRLSTHIENHQSLNIIHKYGFKKDGCFSFHYKGTDFDKSVEQPESVVNLMSTSTVWHFITKSSYYMMANGYMSCGWEFIKLDYELVDRLVKENRVYGTIKNGRITAVMILGDEPNYPGGISISYIDGNIEGIKKLLDYTDYYVRRNNKNFISIMATMDDRLLDLLQLSEYGHLLDKPREADVFVYIYKLP